MSFVFLDPGPLVDGELRLIAPHAKWIDELLRSATHPKTFREEPAEANQTRQKLLEFLRMAPGGMQLADPSTGRVPAYHFWMLSDPPIGDPAIHIAGGMGVRVGTTREIELYSGNIGYHV